MLIVETTSEQNYTSNSDYMLLAQIIKQFKIFEFSN